jgi:hypothetical protein
MRRKTEQGEEGAVDKARQQGVTPRDRVRADLEARGVDASASEMLAGRVIAAFELGSEGYAALLDGVALGFGRHSDLGAQLDKGASDLQEIERLMGSFASELSKLDEVLEVLAAYLRRMRTAAPPARDRLLH